MKNQVYNPTIIKKVETNHVFHLCYFDSGQSIPNINNDVKNELEMKEKTLAAVIKQYAKRNN